MFFVYLNILAWLDRLFYPRQPALVVWYTHEGARCFHLKCQVSRNWTPKVSDRTPLPLDGNKHFFQITDILEMQPGTRYWYKEIKYPCFRVSLAEPQVHQKVNTDVIDPTKDGWVEVPIENEN